MRLVGFQQVGAAVASGALVGFLCGVFVANPEGDDVSGESALEREVCNKIKGDWSCSGFHCWCTAPVCAPASQAGASR